MKERLLVFTLGITISLAAGGSAFAVGARVETGTQSPVALMHAQAQEDTWAVIEYPEGREVVVELAPGAAGTAASGTARVLRGGGETTIDLDATGLAGDAGSYQVYAVDALGNATVLGTLTVTDGAGTLSVKTPLDRFMLVLSSDAELNRVGPETSLALRSTVPGGFTAIPRASEGGAEDVGGEGAGSRSESAASEAPADYEAPMLDINSLKRGADARVRALFAGGFEGARADVVLKPRKNGSTEIRLSFHELSQAEGGGRFILWAVAPDNTYTLLGQLATKRNSRETGIKAETPLRDFGLIVTAEGADVAPATPKGSLVATVVR